jgi:hypothetical protein
MTNFAECNFIKQALYNFNSYSGYYTALKRFYLRNRYRERSQHHFFLT